MRTHALLFKLVIGLNIVTLSSVFAQAREGRATRATPAFSKAKIDSAAHRSITEKTAEARNKRSIPITFTEACADCTGGTKQTVMHIDEDKLKEVINIVNFEDSEDSEKETKAKDEEKDELYEELACLDEDDSRDRALCLIDNINEIRKQTSSRYSRSSKGNSSKYASLYKEAKKVIFGEIIDAYSNVDLDGMNSLNIADPRASQSLLLTQLSSVKTEYSDISDAIMNSGDAQLKRDMRSLEDRMSATLKKQFRMAAEENKADRLMQQMDEAQQYLDYASMSGNPMYQAQAQAQVDYLNKQMSGNYTNFMKISNSLNPSSDIMSISRITGLPSSSMGYMQDYFDMAYQNIMSSIGNMQLQTGNTFAMNSARSLRATPGAFSLFGIQNSMLQDNNMGLFNDSSVDDIVNSNSIITGSPTGRPGRGRLSVFN